MKDSTHIALAGTAYTLLHLSAPPTPLHTAAAALSCAVCGSLVVDLDYEHSTITTLLFTLCPPLRTVYPHPPRYERSLFIAKRLAFSHTLWFNLPLALLALTTTAGVPRYGLAFVLGQVTHLLADMWHEPLPLCAPLPLPHFSYVPERWRFPAGYDIEYRLNRAVTTILVLLISLYLLCYSPLAAGILMSSYGAGHLTSPRHDLPPKEE